MRFITFLCGLFLRLFSGLYGNPDRSGLEIRRYFWPVSGGICIWTVTPNTTAFQMRLLWSVAGPQEEIRQVIDAIQEHLLSHIVIMAVLVKLQNSPPMTGATKYAALET